MTAVLVTGALVLFVLFGLSRWAHLVRVAPAPPGGPADPAGRSGTEGDGGGVGGDADRGGGSDGPRPFGRGTAWLAVPGDDPAAVGRTLGLRTALPAGWRAGLLGAREGLFVAPPLGGFVCAIGTDAWQRGDFGAIAAALERLSAAHGEAFWFLAEERDECFGWAMARRGSLDRAFCYDGGAQAVLWQHGPVTVAETRLGFFVDDPRDRSDDAIKWWPVAGDVLALAAAWSVDPVRSPAAGPGTGLLGRW